ncbi:MAG: hypothetical protein ACP5OR_08220, partial [Candidatus Dormibacteria bacterium]
TQPVLLLPDLLEPADTGCGKRRRIPGKRPENEPVTHNRFIPKIELVTKDFVEYLNKTTFNYSLLDLRST